MHDGVGMYGCYSGDGDTKYCCGECTDSQSQGGGGGSGDDDGSDGGGHLLATCTTQTHYNSDTC